MHKYYTIKLEIDLLNPESIKKIEQNDPHNYLEEL